MKPCVAPLKRPSVMSATRIGEACADDGAGDAEHLAHARSAARSFIADDDDIAGLDLASVTAAMASSSRLKTRAGPGVLLALWPASLMTQPSGRERAAQDGEAAAWS